MAVRTLRYNTFEGRTWKGATFVTDTDALAFCEAAQIYDRNQQKAIVDLVRRLKTAGLWSKMKAIYPFIGGTASSHKWNLKDPRDVDAAFRLTFFGGLTHSSTGIDPNGLSGWAKTHFIPAQNAAIGSVSYGCYIRENGDVASGGGLNDMACGIATFPARHMALAARYFNAYYGDCWSNNIGRVTATNTDKRGFYIQTRTSTTDFRGFKNGTQIGSTNTTNQSSADFDGLTMSFGIFCFNQANDNATNYSREEQAFAFIGDGITATEAVALNNIVDLYQRRLGRNV